VFLKKPATAGFFVYADDQGYILFIVQIHTIQPKLSQRHTALSDRILKVNHAGENGAVNIYRGQSLIAQFFWPMLVSELQEFESHEYHHRALFEAEMNLRGTSRCKSFHLCAVGGYLLGMISALCGPSAIAATTVAVEQVVLSHLRLQITQLQSSDHLACMVIQKIIEDEQSHHDCAAAQLQQGAFWPKLFRPIVSVSTEAVIWLGMRL
jgi:3-demethoxyubiquinol 3-hydroxylase